jgi:hypothetical protein
LGAIVVGAGVFGVGRLGSGVLGAGGFAAGGLGIGVLGAIIDGAGVLAAALADVVNAISVATAIARLNARRFIRYLRTAFSVFAIAPAPVTSRGATGESSARRCLAPEARVAGLSGSRHRHYGASTAR